MLRGKFILQTHTSKKKKIPKLVLRKISKKAEKTLARTDQEKTRKNKQMKKTGKTQITKIKNEGRDITTDITEIKCFIREY